jgi:DhnA family fructose-bisphosphate aldolase class Ia
MRAIVESCPTPILIAGGPRKASDDDSLALFHGAVEAGAAGVICGRNIFQSGNAAEFLARARKALDGGLQ